MPFRSLRSYISFLEKKGDLARIRAPVDPVLEITEVVTRVVKHQGPALLFENVKGSDFPLLMNTFGARRRIEWMLGRPPAEIGASLVSCVDQLMPPTPARLWRERSTLKRLWGMRYKTVARPPVFNHTMTPVRLSSLPIPQSWPKDAGRFLTFPLVLTRSLIDGKQNLGVYRMQVYSENETGLHWQIGKGGGFHYNQAEDAGRPLPVAAVVGADPILMFCGVMPLPEGFDEALFAGFLRGEATRVVRSKQSSLLLPAEAEFILEGHAPLNENRLEGPYGDHFGHYSRQAPYPLFRIDRIRHRKNPIFPASVVGKPPQEDTVMGEAIQEILLPFLKFMHPELVDLWAYQEAGFHNLLVASVRQRFKKESLKTALWILGEGQLALTKCVILVGPDVNPRRFSDVLKAIRENFDPRTDFVLLPATSQDTLDFTGPKINLGSKMILDATKGAARPVSNRLQINLINVKKADRRILDVQLVNQTLLAVQVKLGGRAVLEKLNKVKGVQDVSLVACVSEDVPLNDPVLLLWGLFTRFDCARDTFFQKVEIQGGHPVYSGPLFIDASWKPGYPEPLEMASEIKRKVDQRWLDYGIPLKGV